MKRTSTKHKHRFRWGTGVLVATTLMFAGLNSHAAPVAAKEAGVIADNWYGGFIERDSELTEEQKQTLLDNMKKRSLNAICADGELRKPSVSCNAMAYVATYIPSGFVIVAGDDSNEAILGYSGSSTFRWDDQEHNAMRGMMTSALQVKRQERLDAAKLAAASNISPPPALPHVSWRLVRQSEQSGKKNLSIKEYFTRTDSTSSSVVATAGAPLPPSPYPNGVTEVLWASPEWDQDGFYNDVVESLSFTSPTGKTCTASNVLTGCTATSMAILTRMHGWPSVFDTSGNRSYRGSSTHSYNDTEGNCRYTGHFVDYTDIVAWRPLWTDMPYTSLNSANTKVAQLMYDMGVLVNSDFEEGGTAGDYRPVETALTNNLGYVGGTRYDDSANSNTRRPAFVRSLLAGLPVPVIARHSIVFNNEPDYHMFLITGYQGDVNAGQFYVNYGWNGRNSGWYAATDFNAIPDDWGQPNLASTYKIVESFIYYQPSNSKYVNVDYTDTTTNGRVRTPYKTIAAARSALPTHGSLWIKADPVTYAAATTMPTSFTNMTIRAYQGSVAADLGINDATGNTITANIGGRLKIAPAISQTSWNPIEQIASNKGVYIFDPAEDEKVFSPSQRVVIRSVGKLTIGSVLP